MAFMAGGPAGSNYSLTGPGTFQTQVPSSGRPGGRPLSAHLATSSQMPWRPTISNVPLLSGPRPPNGGERPNPFAAGEEEFVSPQGRPQGAQTPGSALLGSSADAIYGEGQIDPRAAEAPVGSAQYYEDIRQRLGQEAPQINAQQLAQRYRDLATSQFGEMQGDLGQALAARAYGTAPSAAELMLQRARDRNIADVRSQVASQAGLSPGMAARLVSRGTAQANQEAVNQASLLRAQEQSQAEQNFAQFLSGARGQDVQSAQFESSQLLQGLLANQQSQAMQEQRELQLIGMGLTQIEAQRQAALEMERIRMQQYIGEQELAEQRRQSDRGFWGTLGGGLLSALGTLGGGFLAGR